MRSHMLRRTIDLAKNWPNPKTQPERARKFWILNTIFSTQTRNKLNLKNTQISKSNPTQTQTRTRSLDPHAANNWTWLTIPKVQQANLRIIKTTIELYYLRWSLRFFLNLNLMLLAYYKIKSSEFTNWSRLWSKPRAPSLKKKKRRNSS